MYTNKVFVRLKFSEFLKEVWKTTVCLLEVWGVMKQQNNLPHQFYCLAQRIMLIISCSVTSDSLWSHRLEPTRFLCPWDSPGKNIGVCSHSLLQGIFLTQGSNPGLLHCRVFLYPLSHEESPAGRIVILNYL